jgi:hypothetical protein
MARIILEEKPLRMLEWFVHNWHKEIGMLGIGRVESGNIIIEKWVFPKQTVSAGEVYIDKEKAWKELVKQLSAEELERIICYAHTHPAGMLSPSTTDEEETFEVFNNGRKLFSYIIAAKSGGGVGFWARISISEPVKGDIPATVERWDDNKLREECEKIIEECVEEKQYSNYSLPQYDSDAWIDSQGLKGDRMVADITLEDEAEISSIEVMFNDWKIAEWVRIFADKLDFVTGVYTDDAELRTWIEFSENNEGTLGQKIASDLKNFLERNGVEVELHE